MAVTLSLAEQLDALIARIDDQVPGLQSVIGLEDLEEAIETTDLLPAAVVIFSGDFPEKPNGGVTNFTSQKMNRYWSVILVLELTRGPAVSLDLLEAVRKAGVGWQPCRGVKFLTAAGSRFITKFDKTRVVYEVRFATMTTI